MSGGKIQPLRRLLQTGAVAGALIGWTPPSDARVTSIVIDSTASVAGAPIPYTTYKGRVFGELDPTDPHNTVIQDIGLAPLDSNAKVPYIATFQITTPTTPSQGNGLLIYEVPNRGGNAIPAASSLVSGATYLQSGWQGDLLAQCTTPYPCVSLTAPYNGYSGNAAAGQVIQVPVATNNGTPITGPVYGHIVPSATGFTPVGNTAQMVIKTTAVPYKPLSMDTTQSQFWSVPSQTVTGVDGPKTPIPSSAWAWADCRTVPFPGTPDPTRICLRNGYNSNLLYEMVFTARDPLVLGVGYAATRDAIAFFHRASVDDNGTANPIAGRITKVISVGASQSGAFIRSGIFYGFNQDETNQQVVDGAWPQIDGRQLFLNVRFALPDVDMTLYMVADEAPVWWSDYPNLARGFPPAGMLDRCTATSTCPQIMETFGAEEFWDLKFSPNLIGMTAAADIPLPSNVHRYFFPGVTHGGGSGGFTYAPASTLPPATGCTLPANPNPESDTNNALQADFIALIMSGTPMPPSVYPKLSQGQLVPPTQSATGFPNIPGFPFAGVYNPLLEYDFGSQFNYMEQSGFATIQPPNINQVLPTYVVKVNVDGNEPVGIASVLLQAPLGTYTGWNVVSVPTPGAPFPGQICVNTGAYYPFPETKAERLASGDPRASVEERYGTNAGYVCAVTAAANKNVSQRFLLASGATTLISQATASNVLTDIVPTPADQNLANFICLMSRQ